MMKQLDKSNFNEIINSKTPVLVDFWATWCRPCLMLAPVLEEIDSEGSGEIFKVNVDENPELSAKYMVSTIPTLILFKDGEEVERSVGVKPKAEILALINRFK